MPVKVTKINKIISVIKSSKSVDYADFKLSETGKSAITIFFKSGKKQVIKL